MDGDAGQRIEALLRPVAAAARRSRIADAAVRWGLLGVVVGVIWTLATRPALDAALAVMGAALGLAAAAGAARSLLRERPESARTEAALALDRLWRLEERLLTAAECVGPGGDARASGAGPLAGLLVTDAARRLPPAPPPDLVRIAPPRLLPVLGLGVVAALGLALGPDPEVGPRAPAAGPASDVETEVRAATAAAEELERGRPDDPETARLAQRVREAVRPHAGAAGGAARPEVVAAAQALARDPGPENRARLATLLDALEHGAGAGGPALHAAAAPPPGGGGGTPPATGAVRRADAPAPRVDRADATGRSARALEHPYWPRARDAVVRAYLEIEPAGK